MNLLIMDGLLECSDKCGFRFSLTCSCCGKLWKSTTEKYKKKTVCFDDAYCNDRETAKQNATLEAEHFFGICPICADIVCNDCYITFQQLDMCDSCRKRLEQKLKL